MQSLAAYGSDSDSVSDSGGSGSDSQPRNPPTAASASAQNASGGRLFSTLPPPRAAKPAPERKRAQIVVAKPDDIGSDSGDDGGSGEGGDADGRSSRSGAGLGGGGGLFSMLPAPKKAQQPADDEAGGMRMLGQGAGDGSLSHVSLARPLSRKARDTAGPSSNSSSSKKEATQPPKRQRLADDEDDIDPDSYFTLDVDGLGSSSKPQAPAAAPLAASAGSDDVGGSSVVADYAVYAAQFAAQGGPVPTTGRDEEQPYAADYGAYAAAYASQYGIAYGAEQADAYPDDEDGDNVDEYGGLDPQALLKLGHRPKKDGAVAIKDIRGSEQVGEARQLFNQKQASLQGLSGTSFQRLGSGVVSMGMKRRHNIMSLAYEARARQQSLEEQAANRRAMQKVTRAKYGF